MIEKNWSVEIKVNGDNKLYISQNELGGVDNIIDYSETIEMIIEHLKNFTTGSGEWQEHYEI